MAIRQTNLFLTAFDILDKGKIPLAQDQHFFFLTNNMLLSLILTNTLCLLLHHWILTTFLFRDKLRFLSIGDVVVVFHAPFCSVAPHEGREGESCSDSPLPPACRPVSDERRTVVRLWSCRLLVACFFLQDWQQAVCPILPFWPWFSHHKTSDLRNSYMAVSWKMGVQAHFLAWPNCSPHIPKGVTINVLLPL